MADTDDRGTAGNAPRDRDAGPASKIPLIGAAVLALIGVGAIALMLLDPFGGASTPQAEVDGDAVAADVEVDGEPLPPFDSPTDDPAVGMPAPELAGTGVDGDPMVVDPADGTPRVLLFVAHWCDVCEAEVPVVQQARADGALRDDVELVAVSTGVREGEANFPPGQWLRDEGWTVPTLVDNDDSHAAGAYGLPAYPYWVFTQGDGVVAGRLTGALDIDDLDLLMGELAERR